MKKYIVLLVFSVMALMPAMAQQPREDAHRQFNPEEFKSRLESYIRERVGLSQAEGDKLLPIYFEMKEKQLGINHAIMRLKRNAAPQNGCCPNYCEIVTQISNLNVELAKIEQTYYPKMCKVVDAKKVFDLMLAEDAFHREMLRKFGPRGEGSRGEGAGGRGRGGQNWGGPRGGQNWGGPRGGQQPQNK